MRHPLFFRGISITIRHESLTFAILAASILGCRIPVVTEEPTAVPYRTEHFAIYYDPDLLSAAQIETIGLRKEAHYARINDYLEADYNGVIEAFLGDTIENPHANHHAQIYETYSYALEYDDGHEIAHVISIQDWGYVGTSCMAEGIAVAAQYYDTGNAFSDFSGRFSADTPSSVMSIDSTIMHLRQNICGRVWAATTLEYDRAGAFIQFLYSRYGLQKLRKWYRACIGRDPGQSCALFATVYEFPIDHAFEEFEDAIRGAGSETE